MKNIGKVSSFSGGELLLGLLNRCFWGAGTELTAFHGAPGGSEEVSIDSGMQREYHITNLKEG